MDSISEVKFEFGDLVSTVDDPNAAYELLLRITSDFVISINGRKFYREVDFPIVEFAYQASIWLRHTNVYFQYESVESDISPLIEFRRSDSDEFGAYSPHQENVIFDPISGDALREVTVR